VAIISLVIFVDLSFVVASPGIMSCESAVPNMTIYAGASTTTNSTSPLSTGAYAIAAALGVSNHKTMQASALMLVALFSAILCTITSAFVVTFRPKNAPWDFEKKGTLSNASQDVSQPRGRMFAVMLFIACMLSMVSMYPLYIYPAWNSWVTDPGLAFFPMFQDTTEVQWRIAWGTIPYVGLMYTALLPSLSENKGTNIALTIVHNIAAPLSMAFILVMETYQLSSGENAFEHFFCNEPASYWGPLTQTQRLRVVVLCNTWVYALVFLGVQVYLGLGDVLGMPIRTSHALALVSFYAEIASLVSVMALPAIQSVACLVYLNHRDVFLDAWNAQQSITALHDALNGTFRIEV
jgi:hypothetical protein